MDGLRFPYDCACRRSRLRHLTASEIEALIVDPPDDPLPLGVYLEREAPTKALIEVLRRSTNHDVRYVVCYVFDRTRAKSAREPLLAALFDEDEEVRLAAADAYAKVGRAEDGPIVMA